MPLRPAIRRPCVAYIPIIRRRVGPCLLLVLGVVWIVPAVVVHEFAVHPCRVQRSAVWGDVQAVDIRVIRYALEMRTEEFVPSYFLRFFRLYRWFWSGRGEEGRGRVHAEMVISQPRLACAECEEEVLPPRHEARIRDVAQQFIALLVGFETWERRERRSEE
ncbi:hypothetical protein RRF57_006164 [Xylaria bambusicola]|uniref:Uncharacterized protein n=1 Tax=Xylaria bambusicola TaxID=326684 RepID=A0AAN7US28_9PEZI